MGDEYNKTTVERFGDILVIRYHGGDECLWLYMYLDCKRWAMTVVSDIGDYVYCWNKSGETNGQTFDKFCIEWFGNSEWLLRKCVGENRNTERVFDYEKTVENFVEYISDCSEDEEDEENVEETKEEVETKKD